MKAAETLFKELGYIRKYFEENDMLIYHKPNFGYINFNLISKTIDISQEDKYTSTEITIEMFKAIKQQMFELRWI